MNWHLNCQMGGVMRSLVQIKPTSLRWAFFVFSFALLFLPGVVQGQTAAVSGMVTDSSGAVLAGANVTARNTRTNSIRNVQTNDGGYYRIPALVPSVYEISFEKAGFETLRFSNVVLAVDQILTLDATLQVSSVTQAVEVNGTSVAAVELESAQISNVVDSSRMIDLPLILRDPYALIELSPGTAVSATRFGGFSVNGQSEKHNNFLLDGVDNNDTEVPGNPSGFSAITPDSTQEFRLITNSFAPEYGRNSGAIVDIVTKSGTNSLHGNAYWFGRYAAAGARDFFNHQVDPATGNVAPKDPYVRNDFGATASGPIIKNKTFWFGNYEGQRFPTTLTNQVDVPTAAFKTGQFTFNGQPVDLSPTSPNNASGSSLGTANLSLDPTIQKILALYPAPNGSSVDDVRGQLFFPSPSKFNADLFTIKVDHSFTGTEILSVRYTFNQSSSSDHNDFLPGGLGAVSSDQRTQSVSIGLTSTLSASLINELRLGANRTRSPFNCVGQNVFDSFGFKDPLGRGSDFVMPASIAGFGCLVLGDSNGQARYAGTYTYKDTVTKTRGRHTFKGGAEYRPVYSNGFNNFSSRTAYAFTLYSTFLLPSINLNPSLGPCNPADEASNHARFVAECGSRTLQDMGWMFFGAVATQAQNQFFDKAGTRTADDLRGFRQHEVAAFVQDAFKVHPNLTLTLGLRWEHYGVPFETHSNFSNLFAEPSGPAPFTFSIVGPSTGVGLYDSDLRGLRTLEPRFGFAWDPFKTGKTSIRGGYGIFHDRVFGNLFGNARSSPPFEQALFLGIGDILPNVPPPATVTTTATLNDGDLGGPFVIFDKHFQTPLVQSWNFGVQRVVLPTLTVEVNYVGQHGTHLFRDVDGNPPQPAKIAALIAAGANPARLQGQALRFSTNTVNNTALFEPLVQKSIANSHYDGLQLNITKQLSNGLQIQGSYTYSHAIDDASDPIDPTAGNRGLPRNSFNLRPERGNSDFDVRHRAVINYIYELPVGRGKVHLSGGAVGRALEGWQLSGITIFSSGVPYDIFGNRDDQHTGLTDRVNLIGDPSNHPAGSDKTHTGPAVSSFALAPFGTVPNVTRNRFIGPGEINFDAVLQKTTSLSERFKLVLRFESYNLFNHVHFDQPGNLFQNTGTFGISSSEVARPDGTTGARQLQASASFHF